MLEIGSSPAPGLPRPGTDRPSGTGRSTRARMPGDDQAAADAAELRRLRRRVDQQEHALARLTEALFALRRGGQALREENRELRLQIEVARRLRHGTAGIHDIAS